MAKQKQVLTDKKRVKDLMKYIDASPTAYQATEVQKNLLFENNFEELDRATPWTLNPGDKRFLILGDAGIIAFIVGEDKFAPFHILGAHSDSPSLRLKENPEMKKEGYRLLNVEPYGGLIARTWLDRPLSIAGRLILADENGGLQTKLVNIDRDLLIIPSLAIHQDREVNSSGEIKPQKTLIPIYGLAGEESPDILDIIAKEANVDKDDILDFDLHLYSREKGTFIGQDEEFYSIGRIDNLGMAFAELTALTEAEASQAHKLVVINDNEEIGSSTLRGADSAFLRDVLHRIVLSLGGSEEDFLISLASSFLISGDQAHSVHPNYPEVADPTNRPKINQGPVIKISANKSYNTDAQSAARFRLLANAAGVSVQTFHNHSDRRGGSTIGPLTEKWTTIPGVDVGNPMLAMHSVRELAGVKDHGDMIKVMKEFFK